MIMVTGGAGFIGSNLHAALAASGVETVVADRLGDRGKWRNLAGHPPGRVVPPDQLMAWLSTDPPLEAIVHLGAVSDTTASDGDLVWSSNVALSQAIWGWCAQAGVRLIYASSAATYGDGTLGFDDDPDLLAQLRPLNLYGWSKHAFDLWAQRQLAAGGPRPPQWAGLKFFNVFGPNEYHKGHMVSVVKVKHDEVAAGRAPTLFGSDRPDIASGEQRRDFIWIDDVVDVILWLLDRPDVNGLFNVGTGTARTYADLALAVCRAAGVPEHYDIVDMPDRLRGQYQSLTQARMDRLLRAGYPGHFTVLEDAVGLYVDRYLSRPNPYR